MAKPEITWSLFWLMVAKPCNSAKKVLAAIAAKTDKVMTSSGAIEPSALSRAATVAAVNAEISILPSRPMSTVPERSDIRPPIAANTNGTA